MLQFLAFGVRSYPESPSIFGLIWLVAIITWDFLRTTYRVVYMACLATSKTEICKNTQKLQE